MTRRIAVRATAVAVVAILVVALVVAALGAALLIRRPLPDRGGQVHLPGLKGEVTVYRDARAVPQIYAEDADDLFRVQGYLHAEDRFFEMDLRRHVTAGRLSELVGRNDDALQADSVVRTMGWRRVAQQELPLLSSTTRRYLQAYADGVNAYITGRSASELSVSYTILGRANQLSQIEPWTPVDSLAWLKAMAWDLRTNYDDELARARAVSSVRDLKRVNKLFPSFASSGHAPIVTGPSTAQSGARLNPALSGAASPPSGPGTGSPTVSKQAAGERFRLTDVRAAAAQQALGAAGRAVAEVPGLLGGDGVGSNSWVVGAPLTASGLPLLANDPHLATSMPGIWVQGGLHCRQVTTACPFDVTGYSFAGLPGVVIGHNNRIAWGMTNLGPDVSDFYLERVTGDSAEYDGKQVPMSVRTESIKVASSPPVPLRIRSTRHGPLLSDVVDSLAKAGTSAPVTGAKDDDDTSYAVSLRWTALTPGRSMEAVFALDRATTFEAFRAAVVKLEAPGQNFVYADVDGHIGYQATGRVPVRGPGRADSPVPADGTWPHPGWDPAYEWQGYVPTSRLPWVEDPPEGFIVAANQAVSGPYGSPQLTRDWDYGFRSQRIRDLLTARRGTPLTVADMQAVQRDTRNGIAAVLVPRLLKISVGDRFTQEAVDLLKGWDYTQPPDSAAAAYFNVVWTNILELAFADELPEGLRPNGGSRWFEVVRSLLDHPRDQWWDDRKTPDVVEARDEVLRRSLSQARLQLTATLGKDPKRWQWGRLHQLTLAQTPLGVGAPAPVRHLVNRGPYPAPGGTSIVDAFAWDASSGSFDVTAAPSMRMVVDLSDLDRSRWVNQTGQSGHPSDSHYDDQLEAWLDGSDYPWPSSTAAVRKAADDTQTFTPSSD